MKETPPPLFSLVLSRITRDYKFCVSFSPYFVKEILYNIYVIFNLSQLHAQEHNLKLQSSRKRVLTLVSLFLPQYIISLYTTHLLLFFFDNQKLKSNIKHIYCSVHKQSLSVSYIQVEKWFFKLLATQGKDTNPSRTLQGSNLSCKSLYQNRLCKS